MVASELTSREREIVELICDDAPTGSQLGDSWESGAIGDQNPLRALGAYGSQYDAGTRYRYNGEYTDSANGNSNQARCTFTLGCTSHALTPWGIVPFTPFVPCIPGVTECSDQEGPESGQQPGSLGSTGRTMPENLREQLAMEQAKSDPGAGVRLPISMSEPRWPASQGWVKMAQNINGVEIHYVLNAITGAVDDFKFIGGTT